MKRLSELSTLNHCRRSTSSRYRHPRRWNPLTPFPPIIATSRPWKKHTLPPWKCTASLLNREVSGAGVYSRAVFDLVALALLAAASALLLADWPHTNPKRTRWWPKHSWLLAGYRGNCHPECKRRCHHSIHVSWLSASCRVAVSSSAPYFATSVENDGASK